MDIADIEANVKTALTTAGFVNVLTQKHFTVSHEDVQELYFDRSFDPPRLSFMVVTVSRVGSQRYASSQVLEIGRVDVEIYYAINEAANSEATMRQRVDTVTDTLDTFLTYTSEADNTQPPVASDIQEVSVKGFTAFKASVSQTFENIKSVTYS